MPSEWRSLPVSLTETTLSYLETILKFDTVAPVQVSTIPLLLGGNDVVVEAMTGSGKTLAFLVPAMETVLAKNKNDPLLRNQTICMFILPSRELAMQVSFESKRFVGYVNSKLGTTFSVCCFVGGRDIEKDVEVFESSGGTFFVGTPGRLCELLTSQKFTNVFDLSRLELLILDEADRLLEFGFRAKLDALLRRCPKQRRTGLFSATQTSELADLARAGMRNPIAVTARTATQKNSDAPGAPGDKPLIPDLLENFFVVSKYSEKIDRLVGFLRHCATKKVLVYTLTCAMVDWLALSLQLLMGDDGFNVLALHGQLPMPRRSSVHRSIRKLDAAILVCTDVAARGLDLPCVDTVIQFDAPVAPSTFIHRIGRTARMGKKGQSVVFLSPCETEYVDFMKLQNVPLTPLDPSATDQAKPEVVDARKTLQSAVRLRQKFTGRKRKRDASATDQQQRSRGLGSVRGDLCESPSVLTLRRAALTHPKLLKRATHAFVSFIRSYKEHECRYIFQLCKIDITDLVHGFALFKVPNLGEIRKMSRIVIPLQPEFNDFLSQLAAEAKAAAASRMEEKRMKQSETNVKKARIKQLQGVSNAERKREWDGAEMEELRKESYLLKLERKGRLSSQRVSQLIGEEAQENALLTTRERKMRIKSKKKP